ncbi:L,D-transpeptidase family protein [Microvirga brassicacearum]|nr:L,D-transpeptidase [Microvirga brassicacearum]
MRFTNGFGLSTAALILVTGPVLAQAQIPAVVEQSDIGSTTGKLDPIGALIEKQAGSKPRPPADELIAATNRPGSSVIPGIGEQSAMIIKLQVLLDRAHASPGVIDGYNGDNVGKAIAAVEEMMGLEVDGIPDESVWSTLEQTHPTPPLVEYVIKEDDVAGPFAREIPTDYAEMAKLDRLAYRNAVELLAEKFHMDENLLRQMNPDADFSAAGARIVVADVGRPVTAKVARLVADKVQKRLLGFDTQGTLVLSYPATIGSIDLPSPDGSHIVKNIVTDPEYWYRPKVNFKQGQNTQALRLAPGPNNPVGAVWIGLDKPTYGIHGTPAPNKIDKTNSHGCVRLTNWDVRELAKLVQPGVVVEFVGPPAAAEPEVVGSIRR